MLQGKEAELCQPDCIVMSAHSEDAAHRSDHRIRFECDVLRAGAALHDGRNCFVICVGEKSHGCRECLASDADLQPLCIAAASTSHGTDDTRWHSIAPRCRNDSVRI